MDGIKVYPKIDRAFGNEHCINRFSAIHVHFFTHDVSNCAPMYANVDARMHKRSGGFICFNMRASSLNFQGIVNRLYNEKI